LNSFSVTVIKCFSLRRLESRNESAGTISYPYLQGILPRPWHLVVLHMLESLKRRQAE
jgi:hypothetical protein